MATTDFRAAITADLTPSTGNKVTAAEIRSVLVEAADAIDEAEAAGGGGSGTVTSVAVSVPAGLSVSGSPVTTSGTIAITAPGNASTQYLTGAGTAALNTGLPISTATQTALDLKANLASPALTGVPTAPTAAPDTSTTQIATTAFAKAEADTAATDAIVYAIQRANHTGSQAISTVTGLQAAIDGKAATSHVHAATDITSGVMAAARLGTGASGSNFLRSDGTWAAPSGSGTTFDYDAYYQQASDIMLAPSTVDRLIISRATPGATTATVTIPGLKYGCGKFGSGFNQADVTGLSAQVMPSGSCVYLDLTNPLTTACIYSATSNDIKDTDKRAIILQNLAGKISSPVPGMQSMIDEAEALNAVVHYTDVFVAATGGDYTTISDAMEAINTSGLNTALNQYRIYIEEGDYVDGGPSNNGIATYNYINMIGMGNVRIFNVEKTLGNESTGSTFATWAIGHHKNLNIFAYRTKYCVHADAATTGNLENTSPNARLQIWENCTFQHFGGQDGYFHDIGMGLYARQTMRFINCDFRGGGIYLHGANGAAYRDWRFNWSLQLYNCTSPLLHHQDFLEYVDNNIIINDSVIESVILEADDATYDGAPADDNRNRGYYPPLTRFEISNSKIGPISEDALTVTLRGQAHLIGGTNEVVTNSGATTISAGYAVKQVAPIVLPNDDANLDNIYFRQYEKWDGSGIFKGFAEEDIAADASGSVRLAKPGIHKAYFDNVGGNVVFGDALELNSAGAVIKYSSGAVVAYAGATKTTDGLLTVIIPDSPNTVASGGAGGSYLEQTPASIQTGVVPRWNGKTTISSAANTGGQLEVGASSTTIHGGYDNNILARSATPMISLESLAGFPFAFGVSGASCYIKTIAGNAAITDSSGNWVFLGNVTADNAILPSMPAYANDAAADADGTLVAGSLYTITGSRAVYKKP